MSTTTPLRLNGAHFHRDKTGLVTMTVPWEVYTLEEAEGFTPSPAPLGLPVVDREAPEMEVGTWHLTLTYQGIAGSGPDNFDSEKELEIELDGSMSQDTLKSNPGWQRIAKEFGYSTTKEEFPENLPTSGNGPATSAPTRNPLHGADSYLAVGAVFRLSFTTRNAPDSVMDKIGEIFNVPPGWQHLGVRAPVGRNWLKLAPKIFRKGNATHIVLEFMLSGPNGWVKAVYNFSQLGRAITGDAAGSGLHSGGLTTGSL